MTMSFRRPTIRIGLAVVAILAIYGASVLLLGILSTNADDRPADHGVDIFIRGNGVHVDLVVPIETLGIDWRRRLPLEAIASDVAPSANLAFGWGDRGVYLETPTWSDLRVSTALAALSGLDGTVMHVEVVEAPYPDDRTRHMRVSEDRYRRLAAFIDQSVARDVDGRAIVVPGAHYGASDLFFEAEGRYSPFKTCNEWTRQALRTAGVRVPLWAPFEWALFHQLPN